MTFERSWFVEVDVTKGSLGAEKDVSSLLSLLMQVKEMESYLSMHVVGRRRPLFELSSLWSAKASLERAARKLESAVELHRGKVISRISREPSEVSIDSIAALLLKVQKAREDVVEFLEEGNAKTHSVFSDLELVIFFLNAAERALQDSSGFKTIAPDEDWQYESSILSAVAADCIREARASGPQE